MTSFSGEAWPRQQSEKHYVYVYAFRRRFYPKRLTNENITLILISYVEENHQSDSVRGDRGDSVEIECRH